MKTSSELEKLDRQATDAENKFWVRAGRMIVSLIEEKGEYANGVYSVDVEKLFGIDSTTLYTSTIKNDEVSGSEGSEYEWDVEEIYAEHGVVTIQCEGYDFDLDDFDRDSAIYLVKHLEDYHA